MPLGDASTSAACYPQYLSKDLIATGHTNFQFVGNVLNNQACNATSVLTEGHNGYAVTSLVINGIPTQELNGWFAAAKPDVVVMHLGTNDILNGQTTNGILVAYSGVVDAARAAVPNVKFFVAQLIPIETSSCADCGSRVTSLNSTIPAWILSKSTAASPIYAVDLWTGMTMSQDSTDGILPNLVGSQKMSNQMTAAIISKNLF